MRSLLLIALCACGQAPGHRDASRSSDTPGDAPPFDPGPQPTAPILPIPGELTIEQLSLPATTIGEAAIIIGPDGTLVLLDVGNASHDDDVRAAVRRLNTEVLIPARGFAARAPYQVEWIVVTHFHGDHMGGLEQLVTGASALAVGHAIVHRGFVDVGDALNPDDFERMCQVLRGPLASLDHPLCRAAVAAPCDPSSWTQAYPAVDCDGLLRGDLATAGDDATPSPSYVPLGGGARLTLIGADTFVTDGVTAVRGPAIGHDMNGQENARSLIGIVDYGAFRYHFAGDLTGHGDVESPDLESHLVTTGTSWYGPRGVDVIHAHHHARKTSSNLPFADVVAPIDGRSRNVVGGINEAYVGSPAGEVLHTFGDVARLGAGRIWVTATAIGGDTHASLEDADGPVIVQTVQHGRGYWIQAAGPVLRARAFPAVAD